MAPFTAASTELARVDEFGRWMVPYSASDLPADGTYEVRVTATDAAGNASQAVISSLLIDSVVQSAPTIASINAIGNDNTPTISGSAEAGSTVEIYANGALLGSTIAQSGNTLVSLFKIQIALPDGNYRISATATDIAGEQKRRGNCARCCHRHNAATGVD